MILRRIFALLICVSIILTSFVTVAIAEEANAFLPHIASVLDSQDFSDASVSNRWVFNTDESFFEESDSSLKLNFAGEKSLASYYLLKDKKQISALIATEFVIKKDETYPNLNFGMTVSGTSNYFSARWTEETLYASYAERRNASPIEKTVCDTTGDTIKVTLTFNPITYKFSLWVNDEAKLTDVYACARGASGVTSLWFEKPDENGGILEIQSLKSFFWKPSQMTDAEAARYDSMWLVDDVICFEDKHPVFGTISENLNLPANGPYGSEIKWSSSDESIISSDGSVIRPGAQLDENPTVTLGAVISKGDAERNVSFEYSVLRNITSDEDMLNEDYKWLNDSVITSEDVNSVTENLNLPRLAPWGSEIEWSSSAPEYISDDGTVTRPGTGMTDIPVILEAKICLNGITRTKIFVMTVKSTDDQSPVTELEVINMIAQDDFEDGVISPNVSSILGSGDSFYEKNGMLTVSEASGTGKASCSVDYNFDELLTGYQGVICVEFDVIKSNPKKNAYIRVLATGEWTEYVRCIWQGSGNLSYLEPDSGNVYSSDRINMRFLFDTSNSLFSYWIDGNLEGVNRASYKAGTSNVRNIRIGMEGGSALNYELSLDNVKVYETQFPDNLCAIFDYNSLLAEKCLGSEPNIVDPLLIKDNLNLPETGSFGSDIEWISSNPSLIAPDGTVNRPDAQDYSENPSVTMTAKVSNGETVKYKTFIFKVMRSFDDENTVNNDYDILDYKYLTKEDPFEIRQSLNLICEGGYGSKISWTSSDESVISKSGRVTRPRSDESNIDVELTASITSGDVTMDKTFVFTVLADEAFKDPQHMTDEDFFGVWNDSEDNWDVLGKLDYESYPDLSAVEDAAKSGDYALAKEELLLYMKNRKTALTSSASGRDTNFANMSAAGFYQMGNTSYYRGEFNAPGGENTVSVRVSSSDIAGGSSVSFALAAWYNEATSLQIASKDNPDVKKRPRLEVVVNGITKTYYPDNDATIRAGEYGDINYGSESYLKVKSFGEFLGNENYRALLRFSFPDIKAEDKITSARLVLSVKNDLPDEDKRIAIIREQIGWDEATVTWNSLTGYIYFYGGIPGESDWSRPPHAEAEYYYQAPRFYDLPAMATEYVVTEDEFYAYKAIRRIQDFITDKGGVLIEADNPNSRGLFPRTLDSAGRADKLNNAIDILVKSRYMDAETCTAILKHVWDITNALYYIHSNEGNWLQSQMTAVLRSSNKMPEFYDSKSGNDWNGFSKAILEEFIFLNNYEDGSYIEGVDSYSVGVCKGMVGFKNSLLEMGDDVSKEYDDLLIKSMYYNALLVTPYGGGLQYGDAGYSDPEQRLKTRNFSQMAKYYKDDELLFIDSFGKEGKAPSWTSKVYHGANEAMLRSDWSRDAMYLFTNVHEKGGHVHADDNHLTVAAFGRTLLNDAGIFTYVSENPMRRWGQSTRAHNTVEINDTTQLGNGSAGGGGTNGPGRIDHFVTDSSFDFLSMTTCNNTGFEHTRNTMFAKQNYWIVTDYLVPEDETAVNSYKQLWHMMPDAALSTDAQTNIVKSNYASGANIIVACADEDANLLEEMGWWDKSNNEIYDAPYGYFEKNQKGITTFTTVLVPYKDAEDAKVSAKKIDVGVSEDKAVGLEVSSDINLLRTTGYYYLSYEENPTSVRTFDKYSTDGQLAFVLENNNVNEISTVNMKSASFVKDKNGKIIAKLPQRAESASFEWKGTRLEIQTDENMNFDGIKALSFDTTEVLVNGKAAVFGYDSEGYIVVGMAGSNTKLPDDGNSSSGEIGKRPETDSSSGGSSSSGGGTSSGGFGGGFGGYVPVSNPFTDIQGHWAEADIKYLFENGIVTGRTLTLFAPEDNVTRAEFVTLIIRMLARSKTAYANEYADVSKDAWYAENIATALSLGLISKDVNFRPNDLITREEMVKIAVNAYALGKNLPEAGETSFADNDQIAPWAKAYVSRGVSLGFVKGMSDGSFAPKKNTTRAESAVIIKRISDVLSK